MTKNKIKKLIPIIFLLIICSVLIYVYQKPKNLADSINSPQAPNPSPYQGEGQEKNTNPIGKTYEITTLLVNDTKYETEITKEISVYDFMIQLQNEGKITFKDKTYTGMGKFIEEINGIKNGNKNWIYYVNNKKAEIGVSNYKINPGDVVSWKYE